MINLSPKRIPAYGTILFVYATVWADIILAIPEPTAFSAAWFILSVLKNCIRIGFYALYFISTADFCKQ